MRRLLPWTILVSALSAVLAIFTVPLAGAAVPLSGVVSQTPVSWTPNIFAGTTVTSVCDQWFGSGGCAASQVWSTAVVNGEVVVAGAFTQACQAGPSTTGYCQTGTTVTRDDIFAYQLGTGVIDPNFTPQFNEGPAYDVIAGPNNTVYVGGAFTTVNGTSQQGLVQLNVNPGVTSGSTADGSVVTAFTGSVNGYLRAMALNGNALYIGGKFSSVDGTKENGVARLNATTGALDTTFGLSISNPVTPSSALQAEGMSVTSDGTVLAIAGSFLDVAGQSRPRLALVDTGGGLGSAATLANWAAPILANPCANQHDYLRDVDFSPDGSFLAIGTTGYESSPRTSASVCDAVARFPTGATGTNIQPTWVDYAGGDSMYSVQVTGSVIYFGGHNRWLNNECGNNTDCEANSVLVDGFAAVDANTGLAIPWFQPQTLRGQGTYSLTAFPAGDYSGSEGGILIGNDTTKDGGAYHFFDALFPLTSTTASPTFGSIPSGLFSQGRIGGYDESNTGTAAMCVDDPGDSSTAGTTVKFVTCDNDPGQNWTIQPDGNIVVSNGLCLDTVGQGTASGTQVDVNTCGSSSTQVWTQGSGNTVINAASGLCLDDPSSSTTNGTVLDIATCSGGANQVWPLPAAPAPASLTPSGPLSSTKLETNTQVACLSDPGNSKTPGTAVQMATCDGSAIMVTTVESNGNIVVGGKGLCLDTAGEGTANGTEVVLNTCGSSTTQVWTQAGPGQTLVNKAAGLCLNISSSATGSTADIATCNSTNFGQQWWLPAV
jgi:hypothetical protein